MSPRDATEPPVQAGVVDLVDQPDDAGLLQSGCDAHRPRAQGREDLGHPEELEAQAAQGPRRPEGALQDEQPLLGKAAVTVGGKRSKAVSYRIRGKRTGTVRVKLPAGAKGRTATVVLTEKGQAGARNIRAAVPFKR